MADPEWVRAALVLGPALLCAAAVAGLRPGARVLAGALLALLWNLPVLLLVNWLAIRLGWWSFAAAEGAVLGVPVQVLIGWAIFWGPVPALALNRIPIALLIAAFAVTDLLLMPRLDPVVRLGDRWLLGEVVALALCALPAQLLARDTVARRRLGRRATLQAVGYGAWLLFLIPVVALQHSGRDPLAALQELGPGDWSLYPLGLLLLLGLAAVHEFARSGGGTPIPFDPPRRLVVTGPYAYLANPMQVATIGATLLLAAALRCWELAVLAGSFVFYCIGLVRWHHSVDIGPRFGESWLAYKAAVRDWVPRWRPYIASPAELTLASNPLGECLGRGLARLRPEGLTLVTAATSREEPGGGTGFLYRSEVLPAPEHGFAALARGLEHVAIPPAILAFVLRLPGPAAAADWILRAVLSCSRWCSRRRRGARAAG